MRLAIGLALLMAASAAQAEPLDYLGMHGASTPTELHAVVENCQQDEADPQAAVCVLHHEDLNGMPVHVALASFRNDRLTTVQLVVDGLFWDVHSFLETWYGAPATIDSNQVVQDDGRLATFWSSNWALDDGDIQLLTVAVPGDPIFTLVRFTWQPQGF